MHFVVLKIKGWVERIENVCRVPTHKCGLAQAFITKAADFLGAKARKEMPARIDILPGIGRKLQQGPPELPGELQPAVPEMIEPFAAMAPSAEAPMTAPGECQTAICFLQQLIVPKLHSDKFLSNSAHLCPFASSE